MGSVIMNWKMILCGALAAAFAASAAQANVSAVQLTGAQGKVLVNKGSGYHPVGAGELLKLGDSLFVGEEASATILYIEDDCKWEVQPGSVLVIETPSPCQAKAFVPLITPLAATGLVVGGGAAAAAVTLSGEEEEDETSVTP
jgi:hypothetical protein